MAQKPRSRLMFPRRLAAAAAASTLAIVFVATIGNGWTYALVVIPQPAHRRLAASSSSSVLHMAAPPQPRQPRRMLKKRTQGDKRRKNKRRQGTLVLENVESDYRPLISSVRRESGEDYWIDPKDLEKEQRKMEQQRLVSKASSISQEKLMTEVKAPYRQNWIGYFSVMVALLSIIVAQFPELLEPAPTMQFPTDL